jgi:hypothetical protein
MGSNREAFRRWRNHCKFFRCDNRTLKRQDHKRKKSLTEWHNVVVRGKQAKYVHLKKATKFVSMEKPDAKVGGSKVLRYVTEVNAENITL